MTPDDLQVAPSPRLRSPFPFPPFLQTLHLPCWGRHLLTLRSLLSRPPILRLRSLLQRPGEMSGGYRPSYVFPSNLHQPYIPLPIRKRLRSQVDNEDDLPLDIPGSVNPHIGDVHGTGRGKSTGSSPNRSYPVDEIPPYVPENISGPVGGGSSLDGFNSHRVIPLNDPKPNVAVQQNSFKLEAQKTELPVLDPMPSPTLFVEGLPSSCTKREASHIFRPYSGFKNLRVVTKQASSKAKDPRVLCFVEFESPDHAARAIDGLDGYKFDFWDPKSPSLKLQYARYQKPRSWGGR